jgi:single-strand DNA-binding protein
MSKGINRAFLLGHVGKDPDIRSTNGGAVVASLSLATGERQKDGQGNWQDKTEWHNLVAFNRTAEIIRDYVRKGSQLMIEGKIQTRSWDDRESGEKKYRTEIFVYDITLLGGHPEEHGRDSSRSSGYAGAAGPRNTTPSNGEAYSDREISDDDIPF